MSEPPRQITEMIQRARSGEDSAVRQLLPVVYGELRALAGSMFRGMAGHTLEPTAVVHEAYAKLVGGADIAWENRAHFLAVAAKAMRQVLADHARARKTRKRGGDRDRVTLSGVAAPTSATFVDLVSLENVLSKLAEWDERQYRVVELRFLGGLTVKETAEVLSLSTPTVEREWRMARAWLRRELAGEVA